MGEEHFSNSHRREGSAGSYGFALNNLASGLLIAVDSDWLSNDEAKEEFRQNVDSIRRKEAQAKEVERLRKEADELEQQK